MHKSQLQPKLGVVDDAAVDLLGDEAKTNQADARFFCAHLPCHCSAHPELRTMGSQ